MEPEAGIQRVSKGGVSGLHASVAAYPILVGPSTTSEFNTVHLPLVAIGCWRVDDIRFAFDSSFVDAGPPSATAPDDVRAELAHLLLLVKSHPGCPLTVFGHADPVGSDDYNKALSGRRAAVVYGLLLAHGDTATAVALWQKVAAAEHWSTSQRQTMLDFTGSPDNSPMNTLIQTYLQKLCPQELVLTKKDFLAKGADSGGKGDYQGCSEFNPLLLFSQQMQTLCDQAQQRNGAGEKEIKAMRNFVNAPNRRVMVLIFRKGSQVDPSKWPCPRSTDGVGGCKKQFWQDGETRRSSHDSGADRRFTVTQDTFACRFYQRISGNSHCEDISPTSIGGAHGFIPPPFDDPGKGR